MVAYSSVCRKCNTNTYFSLVPAAAAAADRFLIVGGKPGHQGSYILHHVGSSSMAFEDYQDQFPWAIDNALALNLPGRQGAGEVLLVGGYNVDRREYFKETLVLDLANGTWTKSTRPRLQKPRDMAAIGT